MLNTGGGGEGGGSEKFKIINKRGRRDLIKRVGGLENIVNTKKWGWDGQLARDFKK